MTSAGTIHKAGTQDLRLLRDWLTAEGLPIEDLSPDLLAGFLVMRGPEGVLGMIGLEHYGDVGLLRSLVVDPAVRGAGAGRALVEALESKARARGVRELWLLTIDADRWFAGLGYAVRVRDDAPGPISSTREFSGLCPDDAVLMSKRL